MPAFIIDGKAVAAAVSEENTEKCAELTAKYGRKPGLAVVLIGDDPASQVYVSSKVRKCGETGIYSEKIVLPQEATRMQVLDVIAQLNKNPLIDGILVEREEIKPHYQQLMEIMKDSPLEIVEVYCPLEICKQRNIERGDRYESQSEEQAELMSKDIKYRMRVDTSVNSAEECAEQIVKELFG